MTTELQSSENRTPPATVEAVKSEEIALENV